MGLTHLLIYRRLPSKDWSTFLLQESHNSTISVHFGFGIDKVLVAILICIPKQVINVSRDTNFLWEIVKSSNNLSKNVKKLVYMRVNQYILNHLCN